MNSSSIVIQDLLFKTAFHNKFAETTCTSLGLSKATVLKAYREVEGMVGYLDVLNTRRELLAERKKKQEEDQAQGIEPAASSSPALPRINTEKYDKLIFTDGEEWVLPHMGLMPFTEENKTQMLRYRFYESFADCWPKSWFRKVGERKAQLQIPLANLLPPGCYRDDDENDDDVKEGNNNDDATPPETRKSSSSSVMLPPNLQKLAIVFERIMTNYLEKIILESNLVPSAIEKGLFPGVDKNNLSASSISQHQYDKDGRSKLLQRMRSKSVLRMWIYFGEDEEQHQEVDHQKKVVEEKHPESCRGHFDPGVCTILLSGSKSGLQVHKNFVGASSSSSSTAATTVAGGNENNTAQTTSTLEYATHDANNEAKEEDWINVGYNPSVVDPSEKEEKQEIDSSSYSYSNSNVVLMNDTMLQVLTGGVAKHAFHRVLEDEDEDTKRESRIQIVLEFRPDNAGKWYSFAPTDDEKERLAGF